MSKFLTAAFIFMGLFFTKGFSDAPVIGGYLDVRAFTREVSGGRSPFTFDSIEPGLLTELYIAFAGPIKDEKGEFKVEPLYPFPQDFFQKLKEIKKKNSFKVLLSLGGWGFNDKNDPEGIGQKTYLNFSELVSDEEKRKKFIQNLISFAKENNLDGFDIDWEYPGDISRGGKESDFENYLKFLKELSVAFKEGPLKLLLTMATPSTVPYGMPAKYKEDPSLYFKWLKEVSFFVDRLHLMTYDYHGSFDDPKLTGVNAPLMQDSDPNSILYVAKTVERYLAAGIPKEKLILGIPLYGRTFGGVTGVTESDYSPRKPFKTAGAAGPSTHSPGLLAYYEIADMISNKKLNFGTDQVTDTAVAFDVRSGEWVSFDTKETVALKAKLAKEKGLQGIMFWSIDLDEYQWIPKFPNVRSGEASLKS